MNNGKKNKHFMPQISSFFGIIIMMFYEDHNPPHFHVRYGEYNAAVGITDLSVLEGILPPRVLGLTIEWASQHKEELISDWEKAKEKKELDKIEPLR